MRKHLLAGVLVILFLVGGCNNVQDVPTSNSPSGEGSNDEMVSALPSEQPTQNEAVARKSLEYDLNEDGCIQAGEFPYPIGTIYGIPHEYEYVYNSVAKETIDEMLLNVSELPLLILPSLTIYAQYQDDDGNTNYVGGLAVYLFYDLGANPEQLPEPAYSSFGSSGCTVLITMTSEGNLVDVQETLDGADNTKRIQAFCGPFDDLANALTNGSELPSDPIFQMPKGNDLLLSYLNYFFL